MATQQDIEKMTDQELFRVHAVHADSDMSKDRRLLANEIARRQASYSSAVATAAERQAAAAERQAEAAERAAAATVSYTRYTFGILVAALLTAIAAVVALFAE